LILLATLARHTGGIRSALVCGPIAVLLIVADVRRYGFRFALRRAVLFTVSTLPAVALFARHFAFSAAIT
jgi:hypothetical protein